MPDLDKFSINGTAYNLKDGTARSTADKVTLEADYDRQASIAQFGGRSLAALFADEIATHDNVYAWIQARTQVANFAGLRIGDYIDVPVAAGANVPAQTVRYHIAAIDPYYQCADTAKGHHIAFVPSAPVLVTGSKASNSTNIKWSDTNSNNGTASVKCPYLNSKLHGWEISDYLPALPAELRNVLMAHRVLLEERYGSGSLTEDSGWSWQDLGKIWSLSEMEVYGCQIWGSKGYGAGFDCHFPFFADTAHRIDSGRAYWWLRSVAGGSASLVCYVSGYGGAGDHAATYEGIRPRPCFLIG